MHLANVPQEGNTTLDGQRKLMYAVDAHGRSVQVRSRGWEAEEIVTRHALDALAAHTERARTRVLHGVASPLEYWMHARRMDVTLLSQASGVWRWRVRRHLKPAPFAALSVRQLSRYAHALGLTVDALRSLP